MKTQETATSLQAKILAINIVNKTAKEIQEHETKQLSPFIGSNPLKNEGSFKAKIKHEKLNIQSTKFKEFGFEWHTDTSYYLTPKHGYFVAVIRTCVTGGGVDRCGVNKFCIYETKEIDLFKIDSEGNFCENTRICDDYSQYDESELLSIAKEIKQAAEIYSQSLAKMPYQFREVLNIERLTR